MQGYVLVFRPASGDGTIVTDCGRVIRFNGTADGAELHGGDRVSFELGGESDNGTDSPIHGLRVMRKGPQHLASFQGPMIRELHATVRMETPVS